VSAREEVLRRVAALIREVVAEPWVEDVPIHLETSFSRDLELESIEFVALAERLQNEFGRQVDFTGWLADKELDEIIGLRVDEVVDFIVTCQSSDTAI
jgi:acyl carrier protein